jgi:hypothetical protein
MNEDKTDQDPTAVDALPGETEAESAGQEPSRHKTVRVVLKHEPGRPVLVSEREAESLAQQGLVVSAASLDPAHSGAARRNDGEVIPEGVARDEHDTETGDLTQGTPRGELSGQDKTGDPVGPEPESKSSTTAAGKTVTKGTSK